MSSPIGCRATSPAIMSTRRLKSAGASDMPPPTINGANRRSRRTSLADPPGFLTRWSRLKRADREKALRHDLAPPAPATVDSPEPAIDPLADLPALETLTKDSGFRAFMRPGVPEELRNQALRKLWGSDPVYANLDGLLEYGEDFAAPFRMAGVVATVYRVLEGMPEPEKPAEPAPETAAATPASVAASAESAASETPAEEAVAAIEPQRADAIE